MKKSILILFFFGISWMSWGQQSPCFPTPNGTQAGDEPPGCVMCGPSYSGTTEGANPFIINGIDFPCGDIENNVFITIYSDSIGMIELGIFHSACTLGNGLHGIIYDQSFNTVSNCFSLGGVGFPGNIIAENLTPYSKYYLMIDGWEGAECEFLLVNAREFSPPADSIPIIHSSLDTNVTCVGEEVCYTVEPIRYAEGYLWDIPANAELVSGGTFQDTFACVRYIDPGASLLGVEPYYPCHPSQKTTLINTVVPIPPTVKPLIEVCPFDMPYVVDTFVFEDYGTHWINKPNPAGCDSSILFTIVPKIQRPIRRSEVICAGDFFQIDTFSIGTSGTIQLVVGTQANGCDSLVILDLIVVDSLNSVDLQCDFDGTNVQLTWDENELFDQYLLYIDGVSSTVSDNSWTLDGTSPFPTFVGVEPTDGNGCLVGVGSVLIDPNNLPVADFEIETITCVQSPTIVRFSGAASPNATFEWDFGVATIVSGSGRGPYLLRWQTPGTYEISLTIDGQNCLSQPAVKTVEVLDKLPQPKPFCISNPQQLAIGWETVPGANGYQIDVITGQSGILNPSINTFSLTSITNNATFLVNAISDIPCQNSLDTITCRLGDCPPEVIQQFDFEPICQNGLQSIFPLPSTTADLEGQIRWEGNGIVDNKFMVNSSDIFSGQNTAYYFIEKNGCIYFDSTTLEVIEMPSSNFLVETPVCRYDTIELYYPNTTPINTSFNWRLDGAQVIDGQGFASDPWQLVWDELGSKTVSLQVTDRGCQSAFSNQIIEIQRPNEVIPEIACEAIGDTILFTWLPIPLASDYEIFLNGDSLTTTGEIDFTFINDLNLDSVQIRVQPIGNTLCPFPGAEFTCGTVVGTNRSFDESRLQITPNPSTGLFSLSGNDVISSLQLFAPSGQLLLSQNVNASRAEINLEHLPKGVYFLKVEMKGQVWMERLMLTE